MSGAEALAGIGILCNVMQIVTFGKDALEVYRYVRDNGTPDAKLEGYLANASTSYQEMRTQVSESASLTSDQKEVINIAEEAYKGLEKLRIHFKDLFVDERSRKGFRGRLRVAKSGIKTLLRGKELEDLERNFQRYQQLLQTRLIHRVCNQSDAITLLAQESFATLSATQQSMIRGIAQGLTELSVLVSQKAIETENHITDQHKETRTTLGQHLSITENRLHSHISASTSVVQEDLAYRSKTADELKRHNQILASLRYPEMNGRKNHVVESFPETFQWIFSSEGPWEDTSSSSDDQSIPSDDESSSSGDEDSVSGKASSHEEHRDNKETNGHPDADKDQGDPSFSDASYSDDDASIANSVPEPTTFTLWLGSESRLFWISGKPASGKSTLMKFIAASSDTRDKVSAWRSNVTILSHYFWKAGNVMERSLKGCLLSLTHQVLLDRVELSQQMWEDMPAVRQKWSPADWDIQQLETALLWAIEATEESFLLLIDGLDESEEFEKHLSTVPQRPTIIDRLTNLENVKICVSSREEHTFLTYFEGVERIQLHELTAYDIRQFANVRLQGLIFAQSEDRERLLDMIVSRASGVFLWVALVLDSVTRAARIDNSIDSLIERVDHMPRDLVDLVREMWERSGEDGEIHSYRASASRYFNLANRARKEDYDDKELWVSSILFLAIASDKQGLESMLDLNRTWGLEELEMICSKTEKEIRIVCHGLLEVKVKVRQDTDSARVPDRIELYRTMQVWFAHRCVVDFLRDTESGNALLGACGWSDDEASARLEGSHLVFLSRLMTTEFSGLHPFIRIACDEIVDGKQYTLRQTIDNCVETVLRKLVRFKTDSPYRRLLFHKCIEWHFAGIPFDRATWKCSGRSIFAHDPLRNEFLASAAKAASTSFMETLIKRFSTVDFLNALPAIFRGLSTGYCQDVSESGGLEEDQRCILKIITLTERILKRLIKLDEEKTESTPLKSATGQTREGLQRLVCSWFLSIWVGLRGDFLEEESKTSIHVILHLIILSLPAMEDWDQSILLFLTEESDKTWSPRGFNSLTRRDLGPECFLVANLATAFQIILDSNQPDATRLHAKEDPAEKAQTLQLPEGVNPSLRVVISKRVKLKKGWKLNIWSEYQKEDEDKVSASLLNLMLTGSPITEDMVNIEGQERRKVARTGVEVFRHLITRLGDTPGLPMHPWSSWLIGNASEQEGGENLDDHVDRRSQELLIEILGRTSQV